jgi:hypothetical protein
VIGVYGRGSVEQDQTLLEDGLQVNQILRKSVSGPGFEAVVTKMAWLAKADLNLKSLRMFRVEQRRALPQSAHEAADAVARPGCRCRAVKAYLTPSPVSHERPNMYVASNFTELRFNHLYADDWTRPILDSERRRGRDLMFGISNNRALLRLCLVLERSGYPNKGLFRRSTCGTKCLTRLHYLNVLLPH